MNSLIDHIDCIVFFGILIIKNKMKIKSFTMRKIMIKQKLRKFKIKETKKKQKDHR